MKKFIIALLALGTAWSVSAADGDWLTVLKNPLARASAQNKLVLLDFTGSDWCSWCKKFKTETLDTPEFVQYAKSNLVLVEVDFPRQKAQSADVKVANNQLAHQYDIQGFPTIIVLDSNGRKIGQDGYEAGGPQPYIALLEAMKKATP